jgi:hypothetical protein
MSKATSRLAIFNGSLLQIPGLQISTCKFSSAVFRCCPFRVSQTPPSLISSSYIKLQLAPSSPLFLNIIQELAISQSRRALVN